MEQKVGDTLELLRRVARDYAPAAFSSSLGAEDMVLTDLICRNGLAIEIFTLDTGRLPEETYQLMHKLRAHYGLVLQSYAPRADAVERYMREHGPNAFYESVELRKACCFIRKVEPLRRALAGKRAWITGMRRQQSTTRKELPATEWDAEHNLQKFNPLADWTQQDVWAYVRAHEVPYNALHDKGYPSIGCAPCTRAVTVGEDIRAGRWWWENESGKECGLHEKRR
ncbi:MAG: phosphoadenylyl-sulfate reductase [Pseudomonadota bacterium]